MRLTFIIQIIGLLCFFVHSFTQTSEIKELKFQTGSIQLPAADNSKNNIEISLNDEAVMGPSKNNRGGVHPPNCDNRTMPLKGRLASHFVFKDNTGGSYSIIINKANLDHEVLQMGDEIGVFTPGGLCVGAAIWDGNLPLPLAAWADDSQTLEIDGYLVGEKMSFRIWNASVAAEYQAIPIYSQGDGIFGSGIYAQISELSAHSDTLPPYILVHIPEKDAVNVPLNTNIEIHICDTQSGVTQTSITMKIDGRLVNPSIIGDSTHFTVSFEPDLPFQYHQIIQVIIDAEDNVGNKMPQYTFSFRTTPSPNVAPEKTILSQPRNDDVINTNLPELIWYVPQDNDGDSIHFKVEIATDSLLNQPIINSPYESKIEPTNFSPIPPLPGGAGLCSFKIPYPLVNAPYWWRVTACDKSKYGQSSEIWKFSIYPTNVETNPSQLPKEYHLCQNFPNPFNPQTTIEFVLPKMARLILTVFDFQGKKVRHLADGQYSAGYQKIKWDGCDHQGRKVASGVYFYQLKITDDLNDIVMTKKMILTK